VRTVAEKLAGKAAVIQVDTQNNPALATRFGIRGIPDLVLLRGGTIVSRLAGAQSVEAVLAWFRQHSY
jgi:thioredoxin-like negative regulator of GroEL